MLVLPGRVRQADDRAFRRLQPRAGLAPRLGLGAVDQREALRLELPRALVDGRLALELELDACLRDGAAGGPPVRAEAGLGGLTQRPDAEVLAAGDRVAVQVAVAVLE